VPDDPGAVHQHNAVGFYPGLFIVWVNTSPTAENHGE
jgi:hypothetical protein